MSASLLPAEGPARLRRIPYCPAGGMPVLSRNLRLWTLLVALLLLSSCAEAATPAPAPAAPGFPLTVTDDAGRSVTIAQEPQRLISLASSNTELVYAAGLQDRLVGVDDYSDYPAEAKSKEKVGGFSKPNVEKIVGLAPDLVLATQIHTKGVVADLEQRGLKVVVIQPTKLDQMPENLLLLGRLTGKQAQAERVAGELRQRIQAVTAKTAAAAKVRVFFELSPDLISVGPGTFLDDMIAKAGGESVSHDAQGSWPKLNPETIVATDPQVIILSDHGSDSGGVTARMVKERPGWASVAAAKNNRIVLLPDQDITNRPGPRAVDGLEFLARALHPELFPAR